MTKDEQIGKLNRLRSMFSREQVQNSSGIIGDGGKGVKKRVLEDMKEVIKTQTSGIRKSEAEAKGREKAIKVAENSAAASLALVRKQNNVLEQETRKTKECERRLRDKEAELKHLQVTLTHQRAEVRLLCQDVEHCISQQRKEKQAFLEKRRIMTEVLQRMESQISTITQAQDAHIEELSQLHKAEIKHRVQEHEIERQKMTEMYGLDFRAMKFNHSERIQRMGKQMKAFAELQDITKHLNDKVVVLTTGHRKEIAELKECHLEELQKNTAQLAQLTEINSQTKLTLNQTRVQLDCETRKARLKFQDKEALDQQYEFVQQQCAILQENITAASRRKESWVWEEEEEEEKPHPPLSNPFQDPVPSLSWSMSNAQLSFY